MGGWVVGGGWVVWGGGDGVGPVGGIFGGVGWRVWGGVGAILEIIQPSLLLPNHVCWNLSKFFFK